MEGEKIATESDDNTQLSEYYKIAMTFYEKSDYEMAIEWFDKALDIEPYDENVLFGKASALDGLRKIEESIKCHDRILERNPDHIDALNWKGFCLLDLYRFDESIECYNKTLEIDPDNADALRGKRIAKALMKLRKQH